MRGWIGLAIIAGIIYYFATETDKLDEPIEFITNMFTQAERKLDSVTGTKIQRVDKRIPAIKADLSRRLNVAELAELDNILKSNYSLEDFTQTYCSESNAQHEIFTRDNLRYICDQL
ncbi:hypothetical protein [Shewanella maritima]|uniref:hypothetical protein n=1 Tax=Shewanella maritima TaxID=2520507 RepID=UPI0037352DFF